MPAQRHSDLSHFKGWCGVAALDLLVTSLPCVYREVGQDYGPVHGRGCLLGAHQNQLWLLLFRMVTNTLNSIHWPAQMSFCMGLIFKESYTQKKS